MTIWPHDSRSRYNTMTSSYNVTSQCCPAALLSCVIKQLLLWRKKQYVYLFYRYGVTVKKTTTRGNRTSVVFNKCCWFPIEIIRVEMKQWKPVWLDCSFYIYLNIESNNYYVNTNIGHIYSQLSVNFTRQIIQRLLDSCCNLRP